MPAVNSTWISFLRQYGPIPKNDAMYDESIQRMVKRKKVAPIIIDSPFLKDLITNFTSANPESVILTGTAGDGKTYHCREVWLKLNGSINEWDSLDKIKHLQLECGYTLYVIKDLSELTEEDRAAFIKFCEVVLDDNSKDVFLIAANDGQLIDALRQVASTEATIRVKECVEDMLVGEMIHKDNFRFRMFNLSRISAEWAFPRIVQSLLQHEGWGQCETCSFKNNSIPSQRCPIWENKRRLEGEYNNYNIQSRLVDLLQC